jgi:hypothetical protein
VSDVDGRWDCTVASPMGEQSFILTVTSNGDGFTGRAEGGIGAMDVEGDVTGNVIAWPMRVPKPMPITLNCEATITGDTLEGKVGAGFFGSFPITGTRVG